MEQTRNGEGELEETLLKDSVMHDIDALLVKLIEYGEESMLITANRTTIHVIGSSKGKGFLSQDQDLAMRFHKFCFGDLMETSIDQSMSSVLPELDSEVQPVSLNLDDSISQMDVNNTMPESPVVLKPKRKRGRPLKVARKAGEQKQVSDEDTGEEKDENNIAVDNSSEETECEVSRSGRRIKRKTLESLGYVSLEKKKRKISVNSDFSTSDSFMSLIKQSPQTWKTQNSNEEKPEMAKSDIAERGDVRMEDIEEGTDLEQSEEVEATLKKKKGHHVCQTCGEKFSTQNLIEDHLRLQHKDVWAKILEEETDILVSLGKKHPVSAGTLGANKSKRGRKRGGLSNKAESEEGDILYDCQKCEAKFTNTRNLEKHVLLMHGDETSATAQMDEEEHNLDENEMQSTGEDDQGTKVIKSKKKTVDFNMMAIAMRVDEKTYKKYENFVTGSEFKCYTCQDVFESIASLIKHMKQTKHDGLQENARDGKREILTVKKKKSPLIYKCSNCRVQYFIKENCLQHIAVNNCRPMWKKSCPMKDCDLSFDNNNFFMNHMKTIHGSDYPFFCSSCNKSFMRIREYESHCSYHKRINNSLLNPGLPVMCNECGLRFPTNFDVNKHKLEVHEANKKFICETCGRKFRREDNMRLHLKTHQKRENDPELQCKICKKYLSSKDSLKLHQKFMHTEEKPCVCEICGHRTRQMGSLRHHMKVRHSDDRPYECEWEGCGKTFKIYQVWQSHSQSHALAVDDVEKAKSYGRLQYCEICQRYFPCRTDMNNHMLIHSSDKSIQCNICQVTVKRYGSLKRHMMNVHNKLITGGLSAMKMHEGSYPHPKSNKKVLPIRKPRAFQSLQVQAKDSVLDLPKVTVLKHEQELEQPTEPVEEYQTESTYELQHSEAQEKLLQLLADASSDVTKSEEPSSTNAAERDFTTEAESQAEILEAVKEYEIEETADEVCLDNAGEQVIYLNSLPNELISAQNTGGVIYAVRNSDGSLSLQLAPENS
ncbi:zinc finger protein 184-like [Saccostrea echinata]|uniref:zinc finger protein 184-like n=1 Tax=Saccostrea echinata TaxID=191078 RepID=UPI002A7F59DA|nr:zinc finger protein 184-like [Saccostrea echinata]